MYLWQRHVTAPWLAANEWRLEEIAPGAVAIISRPGRERSLAQIACKTQAQASHLRKRFGGSMEKLPRDWQKKFSQQNAGPPIGIGKRLIIVAQANRPLVAVDQEQLVIPAASAFGSGQHPTTAMSLRLLEETTRRFSLGWRMLDAGTGSGILALAGRRFGAGKVLAIDHDPLALANARGNARLNRVRSVKFVRQDFLRWKPDARYDIIVANLFSEILIAALPLCHRALKKRGRLIFSGILREQAESVIRALRQSGFCLEKFRRRGKWIALLAGSGPASARSERKGKL